MGVSPLVFVHITGVNPAVSQSWERRGSSRVNPGEVSRLPNITAGFSSAGTETDICALARTRPAMQLGISWERVQHGLTEMPDVGVNKSDKESA